VIFLVLVCIATATLLVWLAVELGKIALGDNAYPRSVPALLHGVIGAVRVPGERLRDARRSERPEPPAPSMVPPTEVRAEPWEVDQAVERMVRERLYGRRAAN
jgi:hypothetical protein